METHKNINGVIKNIITKIQLKLIVTVITIGFGVLMYTNLTKTSMTVQDLENHKTLETKKIDLKIMVINLEKQILDAKASQTCLDKVKIAKDCESVEAINK